MSLRSAWHDFWRAPPGRRFGERHRRLHGTPRSTLGRASRAGGGVLLILLGVVFMPLPGPGFVPLLAGAALLAGESAGVAHALDRAELRVRSWLGR